MFRKIYRISREKYLEDEEIRQAFLVKALSDETDQVVQLVYRKKDGKWYSSDKGFTIHRNEEKSRSIRAVKLFLEENNDTNLVIVLTESNKLEKFRLNESF